LASSDGVGGVSTSYSSFVPSRDSAKNDAIADDYDTLPEILAERIRIQNLRFAHFLCGAQEMSGLIKR
jgi:hypothetical protein